VNDRPASKIVGVGRALGSRVVTNRDFEAALDTTEEWISSRTGISERRFVGEDENCATLAIEASREALKHAGATGDRGVCDRLAFSDLAHEPFAFLSKANDGRSRASTFFVRDDLHCAAFEDGDTAVGRP
jgi:hypothetical protein